MYISIIAGSFLEEEEYNIIKRNFRVKCGEIDIIEVFYHLSEVVPQLQHFRFVVNRRTLHI